MQMLDGALVHSASDLNNFTECLHLAGLERAVADGDAVRRHDPNPRRRAGAPRPLVPADILVVAPYNAQRALIDQALRDAGIHGVAVGTVDKFQGREAPVAFYSMATSSAELAPRGLDFLLNGNRLNVAVSRAQALSVLVCSPQLLTARATSIEHMRLLNFLCAYAEAAAESAARSRTFAAVAGTSTAEQLSLIPL